MSVDGKLGKRKTINMNEDIAIELNRLANSTGKTLYSLTNTIGANALEAHNLGFNLEEAVACKKLLRSARNSRMVLVNQDMWYFASSLAMRTSKSAWLKMIRNTAQWQSNVHLSESDNTELVASVKRFLSDFVWDCSEAKFAVSNGGEAVAMKLAFVPEMPLEHTQGLFKAFEGMFNAHGYVATLSTVGPGYISAEFKHMAPTQSARKPHP